MKDYYQNKYLVDARVFESVVSRIENLEGEKTSTPQIQQQDNISKSELDNVDNKLDAL